MFGCRLLCNIAESDFAYWYRWCRSVVCLFVCLSRLCIVVKLQKKSLFLFQQKKFLLHTTAPCFSQIALEFGLHRSTASSPNFAPKWLASCWFERRRHSKANCGQMVKGLQWRAHRKHHPSFDWYHHCWPLKPPIHTKCWSQMHFHDQLRDACYLLANVIKLSTRFL